MVRRLRDQEQRVNLIAVQPAALKEVLQAEHRQIRNAHVRLHQAALVVAHHLLQFQ